jgi:hypothetical protein
MSKTWVKDFLQKMTDNKIILFLFLGLFVVIFLFYPFAKRRHEEKEVAWKKQILEKVENHTAPKWMYDQIDRDLSTYKDGISTEMLEKTIDQKYQQDPGFVLFQIKHGKVSVEKEQTEIFDVNHPRRKGVQKFLQKLCNTLGLPDTKLIISFHDSSTFLTEEGLTFGPIFSFAKNEEKDHEIILIPDFLAMQGYIYFAPEVRKGDKIYPWEKKVDHAVWRGATTGGIYTFENYKNFPRSKLVLLSMKYPEWLNARFTSFVQMSDEVKEKMLSEGFGGNFLSIQEQLRYKYQILVDGNSSAYSHAYWTYLSSSVVFKEESKEIQWYNLALEPFVHYIPVKENFSDLIEQLQWAKENDEKAHEIAMNATKFAEENLSYEDVLLYVYLLLTEYAKLQTFSE